MNKKSRASIDRVLCLAVAGCLISPALKAAAPPPVTDYRDSLDRAVDVPEDIAEQDMLVPFVGDTFTYDSNLFRLPSSVTDLTGLNGARGTPQRADYINDATAGLGAQWLFGARQSLSIGIKADDNRYIHNSYLNNVSTDDSLIWNWGLGSVLTGQIGATYTRQLTSFVNTGVYSRNLINIAQYFAGGRWQVGPHVALFAGIMESTYGLSDPQSKTNNSRAKAVDLGADFATGANNTVGVDYRYTDSRYPNPIDIGGNLFEPDYREDRARVKTRYLLSDKTTLDANLGYIRRNYNSGSIGSFSSWIGRFTSQWQFTDKTSIAGSIYRQVTADLTAQSNYFVANGVNLVPAWTPSEKISIAATFAYDRRSYLGAIATPVGTTPPPIGPQRRDTVLSEAVALTYYPITALQLILSYTHDHRNTNYDQFDFDDNRAAASLTFKF